MMEFVVVSYQDLIEVGFGVGFGVRFGVGFGVEIDFGYYRNFEMMEFVVVSYQDLIEVGFGVGFEVELVEKCYYLKIKSGFFILRIFFYYHHLLNFSVFFMNL
jgi:hypothetical protein